MELIKNNNNNFFNQFYIMVRGIKIKTKVPLDMTIADFWGNVGNYTDEGDIVFVSINITDITDNELLKHSPFGSFTLIQEIDPDTKEPTGWYVFESFDYKYHFGLEWDKTINDVLNEMMTIVKEKYRKDIKDNEGYVNRFSDSDLYWFVKSYGNRLGINYYIDDDGDLCITYVSSFVFDRAEG